VPLFKHFRISLLLAALSLLIGYSSSAAVQDTSISEEDVPYGVASSWLYGRYQLADGNIKEALRHLHFAYRTHPDVPDVAWDFQEALVAGQYYKDALEVLNKLVEDWPETAIYRLQRSHVHLQMGNEKDALEDLRKLRELGLADLDVIIGEATILAGMQKTNQALDVCRSGIKEMPQHGPRLYLTMSVILDQEGRQSELPDLLKEAVKDYPDSPQLHDILMRSYLTVGKEKEALKAARAADRHFQELMDTAPSDSDFDDPESQDFSSGLNTPPLFVVELADMYTQQGNPGKAMEILDPMFDAGELPKEPSLWLARLHLGTNDVKRGMQLIDSILERWPNTGQAWFIRGRGLEGEGLLEEALVDYAKGVQYAPDDAQVRLGYIRGILVTWEKDFQLKTKDEEVVRKVEILREQALATVDLIPDANAEGQLILGYAFRSSGELEMAVVAFEKSALHTDFAIPATLQMSVCFDDLGQEDAARNVLEGLREKFPQDPEVANSLGYFLAEKGIDLEVAHDLIEEALKSDPGTGAYLDSMGWVLYQLGKTDDAFDYMIQAVNVLPDDPIILEHLGLVLLKMGQAQEAEEMLRRALLLGGDQERLKGHLDSLSDQGEGQ
jgi:tetratricopeptide (TPR) repeat protein